MAAYPVGSYYWSSVSTNPKILFGGGTWEQIKDKFVYAVGAKAVGTTGGEESHTLTVAEMPSHIHKYNGRSLGFTSSSSSISAFVKPYDVSNNFGGSVQATGGGSAHNNMPPYITAYCWHRTA